jgi:hypothetical protein
MSTATFTAEQILASWLSTYSASLPVGRGLLRIRRAEPLFVTRNYFNRFKIEIATFDGTGQNPTNVECFVVKISETDQAATLDTSSTCDSIADQ